MARTAKPKQDAAVLTDESVKENEKAAETVEKGHFVVPEETVENTDIPEETKVENSGVTEEKGATDEKPETLVFDNKKYILICKELAGKSVYGTSGLIAFDEKGQADISVDEAKHFANIPGYTVKEGK